MKIIKELKFIIILLVIVLILVVIKNYKKNYFTSSARSAYELSLDSTFLITINDLEKIPDDFILIDIRNKEQFDSSHIENAMNIPFQDLLNKSSYKIYQHKKVILYSDHISQTIKARLLINQLGNSEIYVLDISNDDKSKFSNEVFKYKFQPDTTIKLE